jgi:hypothetical protein
MVPDYGSSVSIRFVLIRVRGLKRYRRRVVTHYSTSDEGFGRVHGFTHDCRVDTRAGRTLATTPTVIVTVRYGAQCRRPWAPGSHSHRSSRGYDVFLYVSASAQRISPVVCLVGVLWLVIM